jgi:ankyrin repeat protein
MTWGGGVQGGKTALHLAAWSGQLAVAEQLLRLGAEVEVDDEVCAVS